MDTLNYLRWSPFFAGITQEPPALRARFFERLAKLPPTINDFLLAETTVISLQTIAAQQSLTTDQLEVMAYLVRRVVVGELFVQDFPASLSERCQIPADQARTITTQIITETLAPIKDTVRAIQQQSFQSQPAPSSVLPPTPSAAPSPQGNTLNLRGK